MQRALRGKIRGVFGTKLSSYDFYRVRIFTVEELAAMNGKEIEQQASLTPGSAKSA